MLPTAVSAVVLPDGRVLYWGGLEGIEDSELHLVLDAGRTATSSRSRVLDLRSGSPRWSIPSPEDGGRHDLFCADQRLLFDGRVLAAGGTVWRSDPIDLTPLTGPGGPGGTAELFGSEATRLFHPSSGTWSLSADMHHARWYPTLVTLPDGRLLVASGIPRLLYNLSGLTVHETEIYDPATGVWQETGEGGRGSFPLYARMHLLPDGRVFYAGSGQMFNPMGYALDEAVWNLHRAYHVETNRWEVMGVGAFGARSGTFSVLLPLEPPYDEARILVGGGALGTAPGAYLAVDLTEVITVRGGRSFSVPGPRLNLRRWFSSAVILPDGGVLALSGGDKDGVLVPGSEAAVRQPELFDGTRWIPLAPAARDRTYHNSAVLLPDGSVLVGGHSPLNAAYGGKGDNTYRDASGGMVANNLKDPSFEIFFPPYLFRGPRPVIASAPASVAWGGSFPIATPDASRIRKVALVRLPSATHVTDADMRMVELAFTREGAGLLRAAAPPSGQVAPPGYYYLFVLQDSGQGLTPSNARIVRVRPEADAAPAPAPFGSARGAPKALGDLQRPPEGPGPVLPVTNGTAQARSPAPPAGALEEPSPSGPARTADPFPLGAAIALSGSAVILGAAGWLLARWSRR